MLTPYRTTPGESVVTFSVHNPDTGAQTVAPAAATLVATTATLRHYSADVTPPCQVRWYEDGVLVDTALVLSEPPTPDEVWAASTRTITDTTPAGWSTITEATLDTDGVALGPVDAADVLVSAYSGATLVSTARSEGDGGFRLPVPPSATYTLRASRVGYTYPDRTVTVA